MKRFLVLIVLVLMVFAQQEVTIRIKGGIPAITIAVPDFEVKVKTAEGRKAAQTIFQVFNNDLAFSRVFQPLSRSLIEMVGKFNRKKPDPRQWEGIGASVLFLGKVSERGRKIRFEGKLYDVRSGKFIFGKIYMGKPKYARLMAHKMGDELLKLFGQTPVFTSKIAFISDRDGNRELYIMDYDGANQIRLTYTKGMEMLPAWSPDCEKIAYVSYRRGFPEIYIRYIYEGRDELVATGGTNMTPAFSPDGRFLAYSSTLPGNAEIYIYDLLTKERRRITFSPGSDLSPCWSPDGKQIVFTSDRSGSPQLYIMNRDGSNVRRITFEGLYNDSASWASDGERIAYVSRIMGRFDIYVLNIVTSEVYKLTSGQAMNENPCWSPDGRHIVFASNRDGKYQIYIMDYDGKNVRKITSVGNNYMPAWSRAK